MLAFDVEHAGLAREVADVAYRAGAHYVTVLYWDQHVKRSRLLHADAESLGYTPSWWDRYVEELGERSRAADPWHRRRRCALGCAGTDPPARRRGPGGGLARAHGSFGAACRLAE